MAAIAEESPEKPAAAARPPLRGPIATAARPRGNRLEPARYLGSKRCRMCHLQWHDSWQQRPHARAWEDLKPGRGTEARLRAGLDPQRDYTAEARCLVCHTVGYGRPGGYAIPDPDDGRTVRAAAVREGVGCESCHGPGSGFVEVMRGIKRELREYRDEELHAAGLNRIGPGVCTRCHAEAAPCLEPGYRFDPATLRGDSFHAHFRLRFRRPDPPRMTRGVDTGGRFGAAGQ